MSTPVNPVSKEKDKEIDIPPAGRPAVRILSMIDNGRFLIEVATKLAEMTAGVHENGGVGELAIKLKLKKTGASTVAVKSEVSAKVPKPDKLPVFLFSSEEGRLTEFDPRQMHLPLEERHTADEVA